MQQSAADSQLLPWSEKSVWQLSEPHFKFPAQSESWSQSPPPTLQGLEAVQQLQSVLGVPLHCPGAVVDDIYQTILGASNINCCNMKLNQTNQYNNRQSLPNYFLEVENQFGNCLNHTSNFQHNLNPGRSHLLQHCKDWKLCSNSNPCWEFPYIDIPLFEDA